MGNHRALSLFLYSVLWQFHFHIKFHVSRSGVRIPVKAILSDVTPMTTHINQSKKLLENILHWLTVAESWERMKKTEKLPWLGFRTPDLETWNLKWNWNCHGVLNCRTRRCGGKEGKRLLIAYCFTQCSNGCSLGSLLFPRQDNHVQRCRFRMLLLLYHSGRALQSKHCYFDDRRFDKCVCSREYQFSHHKVVCP